MKKITSMFLVLAMMSQTAFSSSIPKPASDHTIKIAKVFDTFRYQMTVDLNSSDPDFQTKAIAGFKKKIAELLNEGVTAPEVMEYTQSTIIDQSSRKELNRLLETIDLEKISNEDAGNLAMQFMAGKYQQGASYGGGARSSLKTVAILLGIVAAGVATYYLAKYLKDQANNDPSNDPNNSTSTVTTVQTETETETQTDTLTETVTETSTDSDPIGVCCNAVTGKTVNASFTGCLNGDALVWVSSEEQCEKLGPSNGWDD
jgi:hypothetical protein